MKINDYTLNPILENDISTLSSSINVKALEKVDSTILDSTSFVVDTNERRSNLSLSLNEMANNITADQMALKNLNQQSNILTNLQNIVIQGETTDIEKSLTTLEDSYQPTIEELLSKYNSLSTDLNKNFKKYQEETNSQNYFDGMLGAKPLNPAQILKAVEEQMELVKVEKKFFSDTIEKQERKALEVIQIEIDKSNKDAPFKNIDFGKNMANFTSANINSVVGSVALSQANAIPAHSPKLLA